MHIGCSNQEVRITIRVLNILRLFLILLVRYKHLKNVDNTLKNFGLKNDRKLNMLGYSIVLCLVMMSGVFAQNDIQTERVKFDKGTSSATIEATITGDQTINYVLNVKEGQVMNVSMATDNGANYFNVMEPKEEYVAIFNGSINENMYEGVLKKSGDYRIRVYLMRSAARRNEKASYRLEINVH